MRRHCFSEDSEAVAQLPRNADENSFTALPGHPIESRNGDTHRHNGSAGASLSRFGSLALAIIVILHFLVAQLVSADESRAASPDASKSLTWHKSVDKAIEEARRLKKPILVRAGADWCLYCRKLDTEIAKPEVQKELANWVLVYIDVDENADDTRRMHIGPIPALRTLSSNGRSVASHEGYFPADKLLAWMHSRDDQAAPDETEEVELVGELNGERVKKLVKQLNHREANVREAVIRRLSLSKNLAGADVAQAFIGGDLATRLSAIELLAIWKAPLDLMDPWDPSTVTPARLNALEDWAANLEAEDESTAIEVEPLSPDQLAAARDGISKLVTADATELEAIGARLSRHADALLPEIRDQRQRADSDKLRERLDWLRFRLAASDRLALKWPGGLARLAATDSRIRRDAASELSKFVNIGDEGLLIELFSHPDPFLREVSLRALHEAGGNRANEELSRLLNDPEPNVRAAVLKQMAEKPSLKFTSQIAQYVTQEKDPDLVVHAVRLLRAIRGQEAVDCLKTLCEHASWQVRAEAVDAIGEIVSDDTRHMANPSGAGTADKVAAHSVIQKLLNDPDGFVVSRAVNVLKASPSSSTAEQMAVAAIEHPELADSIGEALVQGNNRQQGIKSLRFWLAHKDERLRASAIKTLGKNSSLAGETELVPALSDSSEIVRIAAAQHVLQFCERERRAKDSNYSLSNGTDESDEEPVTEVAEEIVEPDEESPSTSLLGGVIKIFTGTTPTPRRAAPVVTKPKKFKLPETDLNPGTDGSVDATVAEVPPNTTRKEKEKKSNDAWLIAFRSGTKRPKWLRLTIEPLRAMLKSDSSLEQIAAGLALIPLGDEETALPILVALATDHRPSLVTVAKALRWLPWDQRAALFGRLQSLAADRQQRSVLFDELVAARDNNASETLWAVLGEKEVDTLLAQAVLASLRKNHRIGMNPGEKPKPIGITAGELKKKAHQSNVWQGRVALSLLFALDELAAAELASAMFEDADLPNRLRSDAFRVMLAGMPPKKAVKEAVAALSSTESLGTTAAVAYLTSGKQAVLLIAEGEFDISPHQYYRYYLKDQKTEIPKGIPLENLLPLLKIPNADMVAEAAYLMAIQGDASQIDLVIQHWRKAGNERQDHWEKLVYGAIAESDDAQYVPVLEEIYQSLSKRHGSIKDLYWTIRSMHGPEVLKLRKKIREEVGMSNLSP